MDIPGLGSVALPVFPGLALPSGEQLGLPPLGGIELPALGMVDLWHVIFAGVLLLVPILVVATTPGSSRIGRRRFVDVTLSLVVIDLLILYVLAHPELLDGIFPDPALARAIQVVMLVVGVLATLIFLRWIVARARDAGHGSLLGYLAILPGINLLVTLYLWFAPSKPVPREW